jgi:lipopolysaccharide transport system permease protein
MMMVVFTIFFGSMAKVPTDGLPYPLFSYAGLLPWTFFATAIANSGNSVVGSERMITKIYFPRFAIPLATVGASVVDFVIALGLLLALMLYYGVSPGPGWLLVPAILALIFMAAVGIGAILAALNVRYRDFRYIIPFLVQIWMFATPSVYMKPNAASLGKLQWLLDLNPMTALVATFRNTTLGGPIAWSSFALAALTALAIFLVGSFYFRRVEDGFADVI